MSSHRSAKSNLLAELRKLLGTSPPAAEFTLEYLIHALDPDEVADLASAVATLVEAGDLEQVIRVESPTTHGGIGDFESVSALPERIYDPTTDQEIQVTPSDLRVIFHVAAAR